MAKKLPNPIDKHVGSRVRMRRMMLGMSQEKLGEALGLTFQQVQKYEKGTNRISASRLHHLMHILQVPVGFFFDGAPGRPKMDGNAPSPVYVSDFITSPDGIPLIKAFTRLKDANLRRCIVKLVEEIANDDESRRSLRRWSIQNAQSNRVRCRLVCRPATGCGFRSSGFHSNG